MHGRNDSIWTSNLILHTLLLGSVESVEDAQEVLDSVCDFLNVTENIWFEVKSLSISTLCRFVDFFFSFKGSRYFCQDLEVLQELQDLF